MSVRPPRWLRSVGRVPLVEQLVRRWLARATPRGFASGPAPSVVTSSGRGHLRRTELPPAGSPSLRRLAVRAGRSRVLVVDAGPIDTRLAAAIRELAAWGVPLHVDVADAEAMRAELGASLGAAVSSAPADDLARYVQSVRLERAASASSDPPTVSVVLASRRPTMIDHAIRMLADQQGVDTELIVGMHGSSWPDDSETRLRSSWSGSLHVVRRTSEVPLGALLNDLVERAGGRYVAKWDDDDWYDRHHLADLVRAQVASGAALVGKAAEFVYLEGSDLTVRRPADAARTYTDNLAGGTLLVATSELRAFGGFPNVARSVDRRLIESVSTAGGAIYRTHGLGFVLRRSASGHHTWEAPDRYFLADAVTTRAGLDLEFADIADACSGGAG